MVCDSQQTLLTHLHSHSGYFQGVVSKIPTTEVLLIQPPNIYFKVEHTSGVPDELNLPSASGVKYGVENTKPENKRCHQSRRHTTYITHDDSIFNELHLVQMGAEEEGHR